LAEQYVERVIFISKVNTRGFLNGFSKIPDSVWKIELVSLLRTALDRDFLGAEYTLGGLNNTIFVSKYTYVIPNKEELIAQVEAVLQNWDEE